MKLPFMRNPYNYDLKAASDEAALKPDEMGESLTVQSMAEDADINVMMARFKITGQMPAGIRIPEYGDFTGVSDYRTALHSIMDAEDNFMRLDPRLRARFNNDPQEFLTFASDPANIDELRTLGLAKEKPNDDQGKPRGTGEETGSSPGKTGGGTG